MITNKDTKNMTLRKLEHGEANVIAKKVGTSATYVRVALNRARNGKTICGSKSKKIIKLVLT